MKYTFEEDDVKAGNYILRRGHVDVTCLDKIGYVDINKSQKYCLISMTDGFVAPFESKKDLAAYLNRERYHPFTKVQAVELMSS